MLYLIFYKPSSIRFNDRCLLSSISSTLDKNRLKNIVTKYERKECQFCISKNIPEVDEYPRDTP